MAAEIKYRVNNSNDVWLTDDVYRWNLPNTTLTMLCVDVMADGNISIVEQKNEDWCIFSGRDDKGDFYRYWFSFINNSGYERRNEYEFSTTVGDETASFTLKIIQKGTLPTPTIADNLNRIIQAKNGIKQAIENKGVTVGDITMDGYAAKINEIPQEVRGKWLMPNGTKFTESTWKEFDGKNMDPSNLTILNDTFKNCIWVETIDLTGWNVIKPTQMSSTFWGCQKLTNIIGIEDLDSSECDMISGVFYDTKLDTLDLSKWDVSKSTTFGSLFHNCSSLTKLDLTGWQTTNTKHIYNLFQNCYHLTEIKGIEDLDFSNVEDMFNAFYEVQQIQILDLSKWGISKAKDYRYLFYDCFHLKSLNLSGWNTEAVTNLQKTFYSCSDLSDLNLTGWNTQNVTNMEETFYNCQSLTSFDFLKNWNVGKVTTMKNLFRLCKGVTSIDLSNWNTGNLTNVSGMFYGCENLTEVKMGGDVSKISSVSGMFGNITTTGTFYYNAAYDYSKIIAQLPSTWTAVPME